MPPQDVPLYGANKKSREKWRKARLSIPVKHIVVDQFRIAGPKLQIENRLEVGASQNATWIITYEIRWVSCIQR